MYIKGSSAMTHKIIYNYRHYIHNNIHMSLPTTSAANMNLI